jgi:hypothetical protein
LHSQTVTATPEAITTDETDKLERMRIPIQIIEDQVPDAIAFEHGGYTWVAGKLHLLFEQLRKG